MLTYDDPIWKELKGGYKTLYDPTPMLKKLESEEEDVKEVWEELWNELHHQGDLGEASYAVVPHLVRIASEKTNIDWNFYSLISLIEIERYKNTNPKIPTWLEHSYQESWKTIPKLVTSRIINETNELTIRAMLGALAISKGLMQYGTIITCFDQSEIEELLSEY